MAAADGGRIVLARRRPPVFAVFLPRNPPSGHAKASQERSGVIPALSVSRARLRLALGFPWLVSALAVAAAAG